LYIYLKYYADSGIGTKYHIFIPIKEIFGVLIRIPAQDYKFSRKSIIEKRKCVLNAVIHLLKDFGYSDLLLN
jgi:hypothetical protein